MGLPLSLFYPNKMVGRAREVVRSHVDVGPGNEDCDDAATSAIIEAAVYKRAGMATQCQPHITLHMRTLFLVDYGIQIYNYLSPECNFAKRCTISPFNVKKSLNKHTSFHFVFNIHKQKLLSIEVIILFVSLTFG